MDAVSRVGWVDSQPIELVRRPHLQHLPGARGRKVIQDLLARGPTGLSLRCHRQRYRPYRDGRDFVEHRGVPLPLCGVRSGGAGTTDLAISQELAVRQYWCWSVELHAVGPVGWVRGVVDVGSEDNTGRWDESADEGRVALESAGGGYVCCPAGPWGCGGTVCVAER